MQIHRLFEIVYLLIERKTMTAKQLAEHFEVSPRTILRDIDVLSAAGIPLYTTRGKGGGISLMDGYVLGKALFSEDEQTGILAALQQLSATHYPQTQSVLAKLKGVFVKQNPDWLEVDYSCWGAGTGDKETIVLLSSAILHKQAVSFCYSNARGETAQRLVYPLKLYFKSMAWYLSAYCTLRSDYRMFKLARMTDVKTENHYFIDVALQTPPLTYDQVQYPPVNITLLFSESIAHRVYDEFSAPSIQKQADGSLLVHTTLWDDPWLMHYLFSFGSDIKVLEPPAIRAQIAAIARKIAQNHQ
ncbi:MAG TPA: YafY family protein [Candidatus Limiplasma sp.]|nr:YafY family protein [Candidatus Limiplasma sp.]